MAVASDPSTAAGGAQAEPRLRSLAGATVLQVAPHLRDDAAGRAVLDLATALLRSGARALVAGGGGRLVGELQALGGEWTELDLTASGFLRRRRKAQALAQLVHNERVELLHAHGVDASAAALAAVRQAPAALLTSYIGTPPPAGWRRPREAAQARGHGVIACSEFAADWIAERHGIARDRISVIPRSIDTDWFDPAAVDPDQVAALRQSWHVAPAVTVVLVPGRLSPERGHLTLVDAARMLLNGGLRGVAFVIAGDEPTDAAYAAEVDARISAQGVGPIFRRVGRCPDMPTAYAAADLVALPIEHPTLFSTVAAEAQAMGRPVIGADIGAMRELMVAPPAGQGGARTGWLAQPRGALELAKTLAAAVSLGREEWRQVRQEARRFAEATFAPRRVAEETLRVYGGLLGREP